MSSGPAGGMGVDVVVRRQPGLVALVHGMLADHDHPDVRREVVADGGQDRREAGADHEHLGAGVGDDVGDLGWGEAPVDVDRDGVAEGGAEHHLEVLDAVLVEERHAVAGPDAGRAEGRGDPPRPLVERRPGDRPPVEHQADAVGSLGGVHAQDVGNRGGRHAGTLVVDAMYLGGVVALCIGDHVDQLADLDGSWEQGGAPTSRTCSTPHPCLCQETRRLTSNFLTQTVISVRAAPAHPGGREG